MAIDTGATYTMIPAEAAIGIGCNLLHTQKKIEYVPTVIIPKFRALGAKFKNMQVICHNLPAPSPVEGLIGLDFLKKSKLLIDFSENTIFIPTQVW